MVFKRFCLKTVVEFKFKWKLGSGVLPYRRLNGYYAKQITYHLGVSSKCARFGGNLARQGTMGREQRKWKNDQARINYPKSHTARATGRLAGRQRARGDKTFKEMFVHLFVDGMQTATLNKQCNSNVIKFIGLTLSFVCAAYFWLEAKYFHVLNGCILFHVKK